MEERYALINGENFLLQKGELQRPDGMLLYRYIDEEGKRKTIYAKDLDTLRQKKRKLFTAVTAISYSLNELFDEWKTTKAGLREHTMQNYIWLFEAYVRGLFGKRIITTITYGDMVRFYTGLKNERHLSVSTIDSLQTVIQQLFFYAIRQVYYKEQNPCLGAMKDMKRATERKKITTFSKTEQQRFLDFVEANHYDWYPLFATVFFSGMRCGEVCGLQWQDLDFERNVINISHNLVKYSSHGKMKNEMGAPKTKAGTRSFVMPDGLRNALLIQKSKGLKSIECIDGFDDFVFVNRDGGCYNQCTINKALKKILTAFNLNAMEKNEPLLPIISSHAMRKSFCCRLAEAGVPLKVASEIMGHNDTRTTSEIYMTTSDEWQVSQISHLNNYLVKVQ